MERLPASPLITRALDIAEKAIGTAELSRRLGSPAGSIRAWRSGHATMPQDKFLQLVDILAELDPDWADKP
jgi:hypothetical protein